jgi:aldose 1-epimerase
MKCFVLTREGGGLALNARVFEPATGRTLEISTTEPGLQFYSGNFLDGTIKGKGGRAFPDSPNQPSFPSTVARPDQPYRSTTVMTFGVRK